MKNSLATRIQRLEANLPEREKQRHLVFVHSVETEAQVKTEYEQKIGRKLGYNDYLIVIALVAADHSR